MQLLILATLVAVVAAGQIRVGDDSSDNVEVHVIKWEVREIDQAEPPTKPPRKHHRKNRKGARNPTVRRAKTESDGWRSYLSSSYKVFQNARNFDDAEKKCREEGAHLVSIHSEQENQFVHSLTRTGHEIKNFEDFVYIGLRKNTRTGKWYWTDGSQVNYTKWAVHQPDEPETEHCTQLHQDPGPKLIYVEDRKWNSITCSRPMKYFVCKR